MRRKAWLPASSRREPSISRSVVRPIDQKAGRIIPISAARRPYAHTLVAGTAFLLATIFGAAAQAQTLLPPDVAAIIDSAARDAQGQTRRDRQVDGQLRAVGLSAGFAPADSTYTGDLMGAAVVEAIARRPDLVRPIIAQAVNALPEARQGIVANASAAFPGFAAAIRTAAGAGPAAPTYTAAPPAAPQALAQRPAPAPEPAPATANVPAKSDRAADATTVGEHDPWEGFNRGVFAFNDVVDRYLLAPVATGYGWIMPDPAKRAVRNVFANAFSPVVFVNDLLQLEFRDAGITLSRLVANSTMGIGGLFDVANGMGLPAHPADFGQTLYSYGVDSGPYLVLPLLGPSTVRDGIGTGVDLLLHPFTYFLSTPVNLSITGGRTVVRREELLEPIDELRESSLDFYAALRSAWRQDRAVQLRKGQPADSRKVDEIFDTME